MNRRKLAEYFRRNAEINERFSKLLREAEQEYNRISKDPKSKWESKILEIFPRGQVEAAQKKWEPLDVSLEGDKKIINAAKAGDKSASIYIWAFHARDVIAQMFWKFLGPDPVIRKRRIDNNELYDYLSLAWGAMTFGNKDLLGDAGLIERFNVDMYDHGTVWKQFRNMLRLLLTNATTAYNNKEKLGGMGTGEGKYYDDEYTGTGKMTGSIARGTLGKEEGVAMQSYDSAFDDVDAAGGRNEVGFVDDVQDRYIKKEEDDEFLASWKKFSSDPDMKEQGRDVSPAQVFALVVGDAKATVNGIAEKFGIKAQNVRAKMEQALDIMHDHGITNDMLQKAVKSIGNEALAASLDSSKAGAKARAPKKEQPRPKGATKPSSPEKDERKKSYAQSYYQKLLAAGKIKPKKKK